DTVVAFDIEQRSADRDRRAAEYPGLERLPERAIAGRIVEQRQPLLLLRLGRQRQVPDRRRIDLALAVEAPDAREEVAERERARDLQFGQPEGRRDLLRGPALADQPLEAFPASHLVGVEPGD